MSSLIYFKRVYLFSPFLRNHKRCKTNLGFLLRDFLFISERQNSSVQSSDKKKRCEQRHSFTVSYLKNSCGLSTKWAESNSKYVSFDAPEKPDLVLGLFKNYEFTSEQITKVIKSFPAVLHLNAEKILKPKLEFFGLILGSNDDLARVVSANPKLLGVNLNNQLIRSYGFLKTTLGNDERIVKSIKRSSRILLVDVESCVDPKVSFLKQFGVPLSSVAKLIEYSSNVFCYSALKFEDTVKKVIGMGFNPSGAMFISAVRAVGQNRQSTWEQKIEFFKKWGWSDSDVVLAFRKQPLFMCLSEKKVTQVFDFFTNKVGFSAADIAKYPNIMSFSLEKRIVPRCSVLMVLLSKGVLRPSSLSISSCSHALSITDKAFLKKYVSRYPDHVLELWNTFQK